MNETKYLRTIVFSFLAAMLCCSWANAEECEFIDTISNSQGALKIDGYAFILGTDGGTKMRAVLGGGCQGTIVMRATNPAKTTAVGDGLAKRAIDIYTANPYRTFASRFRIKLPKLTGAPNSLGLTFREIEFTPPNADPVSPNGHLQYSIVSSDGGNNWTLRVILTYQINGQPYEVVLANLYANGLQNLEVLTEYSQVLDSFGRLKPQVKLTYFRFNSSNTIFVDRSSVNVMPIGMEPIFQKHGLLGQDSLPVGTQFTMYNCLLNNCDFFPL